MTVFDLDPPDLGQLLRSTLALLIADAMRLLPVPAGRLPVLDCWMVVGGGPDLLHARGQLDGGAERLRLPLLAVAPERPAAWLVGAAWVQLGEHALGEEGEELEVLLLGAQQWCDALRAELGVHHGR